MKTLLLIIFMAMCLRAEAEMVKTRGEGKVIEAVRRITLRLEAAREEITREYNAAKTYIVDHPSQFIGSDKTKLNGWDTALTNVRNAIISAETYAETEWPGIKE